MSAAPGTNRGGAGAENGNDDTANFAPSPAPHQHADAGSALALAASHHVEIDHEPRGRRLTEDSARELTERIRRDAQGLWVMLLRAYEGGAHLALGYPSWPDYCRTEFQFGKSHAYRVLEAARVHEVLIADSPIGECPVTTEAVARELAPQLDDPGEMRATYQEAVETAPRASDGTAKITAAHVREVRDRRQSSSISTPKSTTPAAGHALRPRESSPTLTQKSKPEIGLNEAVVALRRAVQRDRESAGPALTVLREVAAAGLYGPKTNDAPAAFRDLVEIVGILIGGERE